MRVAIASRIFEPEPSAASFRLAALARAFAQAGHPTTVLTVRPPAGRSAADEAQGYRVRRFPVLRDASGYVRGYLQYLSFDVPAFFRILLGRKYDLIIAEPPPTTGFFVRCAAAIRRTPYVYYAADVWADASSQTDAPAWVVRAVRVLEHFAWRGARRVLSVSPGVTGRLREVVDSARIVEIGNGVDADAFLRGLDAAPAQRRDNDGPVFVYAGTASEWHGADVFVEALPAVLTQAPSARLRFIGGGSERAALEQRAEDLGVSAAVTFEPALAAEQLAPVLREATAAIASVRPHAGYDFAFPTKLYSAAVCGAPLIYSGIGPAVDFVETRVDGAPLGRAVGPDAGEVAEAMLAVLDAEADQSRRAAVSSWAVQAVGLAAVAERAVSALAGLVNGGRR